VSRRVISYIAIGLPVHSPEDAPAGRPMKKQRKQGEARCLESEFGVIGSKINAGWEADREVGTEG
jgi:hypothetical protein